MSRSAAKRTEKRTDENSRVELVYCYHACGVS